MSSVTIMTSVWAHSKPSRSGVGIEHCTSACQRAALAAEFEMFQRGARRGPRVRAARDPPLRRRENRHAGNRSPLVRARGLPA